jgi:ribosomal protein S18 acetylase RimI-like enzyme
MSAAELLEVVEQNHFGHFTFLPERLRFEVYQKNNLHVIKCGLGSSMFNIVYGSPLDHKQIKSIVTEVKDDFIGQSFAWWVPPSLRSVELSKCLLQAGLTIEATEHAMICNLKTTSITAPKTNLVVKPILDTNHVEDFIKLLEPYDSSTRRFYAKLNSTLLNSAEKLFIGYINNEAVTIATLFEGSSACGVFSLLTKTDQQGRGYATDMMKYLLQTAKQNGFNYVTLSASNDAGYRIYQRLGFYKIGEFECFEYKAN